MSLTSEAAPVTDPAQVQAARLIQRALPVGGLFADQHWRVSPEPFVLDAKLAGELESLGRVLLQFYRAVNLLYRLSAEGRQPEWVARLLDQGKPAELVALQRHAAFKNDLPRVIRPDVLLTEDGFVISELDSVPGGIGLTAWLNQTYTRPGIQQSMSRQIIGGDRGMLDGFASIFGDAKHVHIVISDEAGSYRPEMEWLAGQLGRERFTVQPGTFEGVVTGEAVYRFFELFDLSNVPGAVSLFEAATAGRSQLTPPPKMIFEEKLLFALLWNRNLAGFWRQELGAGFFERLKRHVPYTWSVDPTPLPPHAAYPGLELTDWQQLKTLSQRERDLILKVSGFSAEAWGARGVYLGSDLSQPDWAAAVDRALAAFPKSPYVLQRYHKPAVHPAAWCDFTTDQIVAMPSRVRLCPYYFVAGEWQKARPNLGGVLATLCPADKKIIHGMKDAILVPCAV